MKGVVRKVWVVLHMPDYDEVSVDKVFANEGAARVYADKRSAESQEEARLTRTLADSFWVDGGWFDEVSEYVGDAVSD